MTDFLDWLDADLREAAERRGQPRRRRPTGALKAVAALAAVALLVVGAARLLDRESSERVAATPTPTPMPTPTPVSIALATGGDPSFLDLLAARLHSTYWLGRPPHGQPRTADPSLGTVVLYRSGGKRLAQIAALAANIDRVEPLTPDIERLIDTSPPDTDVVVVYGIEDQERLLRDPDICTPIGSVGDEPLTYCVARGDEERFVRFVVDGQALPIEPLAESGYWSWAAAAPDGGTILGEWTSYSGLRAETGCHVPQPALISPADGRAHPVATGHAVPLGWTTDGRAIVFRPAGSGCEGGADPGVYLVAPDGAATFVAATDRKEPPAGLEPSIEPRTVEEVTRAAAP